MLDLLEDTAKSTNGPTHPPLSLHPLSPTRSPHHHHCQRCQCGHQISMWWILFMASKSVSLQVGYVVTLRTHLRLSSRLHSAEQPFTSIGRHGKLRHLPYGMLLWKLDAPQKACGCISSSNVVEKVFSEGRKLATKRSGFDWCFTVVWSFYQVVLYFTSRFIAVSLFFLTLLESGSLSF